MPDNSYYIFYNQFKESKMLRRLRERYSRHSERPVVMRRYGKNWKLLEEGLDIIWPGIDQDLIHYLEVKEYKIVDAIANARLEGVTIQGISPTIPYQIIDKIKQAGAKIEFNYRRAISYNWIIDVDNIINNLDGLPFDNLLYGTMIARLADLANKPFVLTFRMNDPNITNLDNIELIYRWSPQECKDQLLTHLIQDNYCGFVRIILTDYVTTEEALAVIDKVESISPEMLETIVNYIRLDNDSKSQLFARLSNNNQLSYQELVQYWIDETDNGKKLLITPIDDDSIEHYRGLIKNDDRLRYCVHPSYEKYWSEIDIDKYKANFVHFLHHLGIPLKIDLSYKSYSIKSSGISDEQAEKMIMEGGTQSLKIRSLHKFYCVYHHPSPNELVEELLVEEGFDTPGISTIALIDLVKCNRISPRLLLNNPNINSNGRKCLEILAKYETIYSKNARNKM